MLDSLRKNAKSVFIYLIFGVLIIVFILQFGPQSGRSGGCGSAVRTAANVNGGKISDASFRYGILATGGGNASGERARRAQRRERVLDSLIVREILAQTAEEMGFRVSDEEVRAKVVDGEIYILGERLDGKQIYYGRAEGEETPRFIARRLDDFARSTLGLGSVDKFLDEQRRELMAQKVRDLVTAAVRVSPEEAQNRYLLDSSKVEIEYVPFSMASYRGNLEVSAADIDGYLKAHETELKAQYDKEADQWKGRDRDVRIRDLFVKREKPAPAPGAAPPAAADPGKAKADAALAKIKGGQDFVAVARSVDPDLRRGGDSGWRPLRALHLGQEVANAVGSLEKGQVSDVIATPDGFHIVQLVDKREGDLSFDAVKRDLAENALLDERAKAAAKADAEKALAAAKAGTPLDKQFPGDGGETPSGPGAKPRLQKGTDINRIGGYIRGIGTSKELVSALFDKLAVGDVAPQVYEVSGDYFVVRLTKREQPDMEKFKTEQARIASDLQQSKAFGAVAAYQARRCHEARDRGAIDYDPALVQYNEVDAEAKTGYVPCQTLSVR